MKVGDRVRLVTNGGFSDDELQAGVTGVIAEIKACFEVRLDSGYADCNGNDLWPFYDYELEVIQ